MIENKDKHEDEILKADAGMVMPLPYFEGLRAGFPSPAADYEHKSLDFNKDFIKHPEATYFVRVVGDSMVNAGIEEGDLCLVDRMEEMTHGSLVVAFVNGGNTVKFLDMSTRDKGYIRLIPSSPNPKYKPFIVDINDEFALQGKVIWVLKPFYNKISELCTPL